MSPFWVLSTVIALHGVITESSADRIIDEIEWSTRPIIININSGGGDMMAAERIVDAIQKTNKPVTCVVKSWAASAAAYILTACPHNKVSDKAIILYHLPYMRVPYTDTHVPSAWATERFIKTMEGYNLRKQFTRERWLQLLTNQDIIIPGFEWKFRGLEK